MNGDRFHLSPSAQRTPGRAALGSLAIAFTICVAVVAWFLASVAKWSEPVVVLTAMSAAFALSWSVTFQRRAATHRVTLIRVRARTH